MSDNTALFQAWERLTAERDALRAALNEIEKLCSHESDVARIARRALGTLEPVRARGLKPVEGT